MTTLGFVVYAACVDFLLKLALLFGVTYRDANALFFFVMWPLVTVMLAIWWGYERARLARARRRA